MAAPAPALPPYRLATSTTLPPGVQGGLIGDLLLSAPNLRWLDKQYKPNPAVPTTLHLVWWGESQEEASPSDDSASPGDSSNNNDDDESSSYSSSSPNSGTTLRPSVHSLGTVVQHPLPSSPPSVSYPILGGLLGLQRYLSDMGSLLLHVYGSSPSPPSSSSSSSSVPSTTNTRTLLGVVVVPSVTTQGLNGLYQVSHPRSGTLIGEVRISLTFRLGRYGDTPSCRITSTILTDMPAKIQALIDDGQQQEEEEHQSRSHSTSFTRDGAQRHHKTQHPPSSGSAAAVLPSSSSGANSSSGTFGALVKAGAIAPTTSFQLNEAYAKADSSGSGSGSGKAGGKKDTKAKTGGGGTRTNDGYGGEGEEEDDDEDDGAHTGERAGAGRVVGVVGVEELAKWPNRTSYYKPPEASGVPLKAGSVTVPVVPFVDKKNNKNNSSSMAPPPPNTTSAAASAGGGGGAAAGGFAKGRAPPPPPRGGAPSSSSSSSSPSDDLPPPSSAASSAAPLSSAGGVVFPLSLSGRRIDAQQARRTASLPTGGGAEVLRGATASAGAGGAGGTPRPSTSTSTSSSQKLGKGSLSASTTTSSTALQKGGKSSSSSSSSNPAHYSVPPSVDLRALLLEGERLKAQLDEALVQPTAGSRRKELAQDEEEEEEGEGEGEGGDDFQLYRSSSAVPRGSSRRPASFGTGGSSNAAHPGNNDDDLAVLEDLDLELGLDLDLELHPEDRVDGPDAALVSAMRAVGGLPSSGASADNDRMPYALSRSGADAAADSALRQALLAAGPLPPELDTEISRYPSLAVADLGRSKRIAKARFAKIELSNVTFAAPNITGKLIVRYNIVPGGVALPTPEDPNSKDFAAAADAAEQQQQGGKQQRRLAQPAAAKSKSTVDVIVLGAAADGAANAAAVQGKRGAASAAASGLRAPGSYPLQHSSLFGVAFDDDEAVRLWLEGTVTFKLIAVTAAPVVQAKAAAGTAAAAKGKGGKQQQQSAADVTPQKARQVVKEEVVGTATLPLKDVLTSTCLDVGAVLHLVAPLSVLALAAADPAVPARVVGSVSVRLTVMSGRESEQLYREQGGTAEKAPDKDWAINATHMQEVATVATSYLDSGGDDRAQAAAASQGRPQQSPRERGAQFRQQSSSEVEQDNLYEEQQQQQRFGGAARPQQQQQQQHQHQQHQQLSQQQQQRAPPPPCLFLHVAVHHASRIDFVTAVKSRVQTSLYQEPPTDSRDLRKIRVRASCGAAISTPPSAEIVIETKGARPKMFSATNINLLWSPPLNVDPSLPAPPSLQLCGPKAIVVFEVWATVFSETGEENEVCVGLSKVPLSLVANALVQPGSAGALIPAMAFDGWIGVKNPFTGAQLGKLHVTVAAGLKRQVENMFGSTKAAGLIQRRWRTHSQEMPERPPAMAPVPAPRQAAPKKPSAGNAVVPPPAPSPSLDPPIETAPPSTAAATSFANPLQSAAPRVVRLPASKVQQIVAPNFPAAEAMASSTTSISYSSLKDAYLRKSLDSLADGGASGFVDKKPAAALAAAAAASGSSSKHAHHEASEEAAFSLESTGLVKHVLEFRPDSTSQIEGVPLHVTAANAGAPWGCYIRYLIPWEDSGTAAGGSSAMHSSNTHSKEGFSGIPPMDGEAAYGVSSTLLWWDADSQLLNGTARHSLFLPSALPLPDAICPPAKQSKEGGGNLGKRGVKMEIWCRPHSKSKSLEKPVKVAHTFLPYAELEALVDRAGKRGPSCMTIQRKMTLPLSIVPGGDDAGWRASEFLPSSLQLTCFLTIEPKIVAARRVAREKQELDAAAGAKESACIKVPAAARVLKVSSSLKAPPPAAKSVVQVKIGMMNGLRELLALWGGLRSTLNESSGGVLISFRMFCGESGERRLDGSKNETTAEGRWEAFTTTVISLESCVSQRQVAFDFDTNIPVMISAPLVQYMQTHTLDLALWFVPNVSHRILSKGATVASGIHASIPEGSVRVCCAKVPLSPLLSNPEGGVGKYPWRFPISMDGEEEEIGFIESAVRFVDDQGLEPRIFDSFRHASQELSQSAVSVGASPSRRSFESVGSSSGVAPPPQPSAEPRRVPFLGEEEFDDAESKKEEERIVEVKIVVHSAASLCVQNEDAQLYATYRWDDKLEVHGTECKRVTSTGYSSLNDENVVLAPATATYWKTQIGLGSSLKINFFEKGSLEWLLRRGTSSGGGRDTAASADSGGVRPRGIVDVGDTLLGTAEVLLEPLSIHRSGVLDGWYHVLDTTPMSSRIGQVRVSVEIVDNSGHELIHGKGHTPYPTTATATATAAAVSALPFSSTARSSSERRIPSAPSSPSKGTLSSSSSYNARPPILSSSIDLSGTVRSSFGGGGGGGGGGGDGGGSLKLPLPESYRSLTGVMASLDVINERLHQRLEMDDSDENVWGAPSGGDTALRRSYEGRSYEAPPQLPRRAPSSSPRSSREHLPAVRSSWPSSMPLDASLDDASGQAPPRAPSIEMSCGYDSDPEITLRRSESGDGGGIIIIPHQGWEEAGAGATSTTLVVKPKKKKGSMAVDAFLSKSVDLEAARLRAESKRGEKSSSATKAQDLPPSSSSSSSLLFSDEYANSYAQLRSSWSAGGAELDSAVAAAKGRRQLIAQRAAAAAEAAARGKASKKKMGARSAAAESKSEEGEAKRTSRREVDEEEEQKDEGEEDEGEEDVDVEDVGGRMAEEKEDDVPRRRPAVAEAKSATRRPAVTSPVVVVVGTGSDSAFDKKRWGRSDSLPSDSRVEFSATSAAVSYDRPPKKAAGFSLSVFAAKKKKEKDGRGDDVLADSAETDRIASIMGFGVAGGGKAKSMAKAKVGQGGQALGGSDDDDDGDDSFFASY